MRDRIARNDWSRPGSPARTAALRAIARASAAALLAAQILALSGARADTIYLTTGTTISDVEIKDARWDQIAYVLGKAPQSIEGAKVMTIERASQRLSALRGAIEGGEYARAEELVKQAKSFGQDWEKAEAAYLEGRLYREWASQDPTKLARAITAFEAYIKDFKAGKDYWIPHATYALGKANLQEGKPKVAAEQFKALGEFGARGSVWGPRAKVGEAWAILQDRGKQGALQARQLFGEVMDDRNQPAEVKQEAAVGRAAAYNLQEQNDEAINLLNQRFFEDPAAAYNEYYGEACNAMGNAYRGKKNPQEAEIWYLKTTCFFKRYPNVYREAVKNLVDIYKGLGNADRAKEWEQKLRG